MTDDPRSDRPGEASSPYVILPPGADPGAGFASPGERPPDGSEQSESEAIEKPAKVMRIGAMIKQLLDEIHESELDVASRQRLKEIYERSVRELADTLSPDLTAELDRLALPFETEEPSEAELRIAQAQLVGWLEGLFHGIQATIFAQQMSAQAQLEQMRRHSLPAGMAPTGAEGPRPPGAGAYL